MSTKKFSGLGRGLGALIPQKPAAAPQPQAAASAVATAVASGTESDGRAGAPNVLQVRVAEIVANPEQPRAVFRHQELEDLMNSIREHGILQPLTVTRRPDGGYELIAGERRFRSAKMLGMETVPVLVREADLQDKLVLALIENIQREDLNPLEEARAYGRLLGEFGLTQEVVAKQVGKARSTVANIVRLLDLPKEVQEAIGAGIVPAGSARAMLSLPDAESQLAFFRKLVADRMTSREAEAGVRRAVGRTTRKDPAVLAIEEQLRNALGARVEIKKRNGKGAVTICFYSDEEYADIVRMLQE
jgi:ParB family chromosome partitioning protein